MQNGSEYAGGSDIIHPVIMCGGTGSRLWPVSRASLPKQFHKFFGRKTLLQATVERVQGEGFAAPMFICAEDHRFIVADQLAELGVEYGPIVLEPVGRNTGPVATVASLVVSHSDNEGLVLLLPADHLIKDVAEFQQAVRSAIPAARAGFICLLGITPDRPATGYGYIELGDVRVPTADSPVLAVREFVEKPDVGTATRMVEAGTCAWNAGILLFTAATMLREVADYQPEMLRLASEAVEGCVSDTDFVRLAKQPFEQLNSISVDHGILEHTRRAAVLPVRMGWSDLGAWDAVGGAHQQDTAGNVLLGRTVAVETTDSFVHSERQLVATVGLDNVIVIATDDAILVADRSKAQDVKPLLSKMRREGFEEALSQTKVHRPWGAYEAVTSGDRFQVKLITVKPGGRLSLQLHHHRAEHWIVVRGTARITRGNDVFVLSENQSTYIPQGEMHRLENPGSVPLEMVEVQSGSYLGEDDIVRVEDVYGRAAAK
jgi:mannose-1-phosphate guanylyltransferase/mannose-6-phosphate isomerase